MKIWILVTLGFTIAAMLKDLIYLLARKFWTYIVIPSWKMFGPRPGGKLWAAARIIKGN